MQMSDLQYAKARHREMITTANRERLIRETTREAQRPSLLNTLTRRYVRRIHRPRTA